MTFKLFPYETHGVTLKLTKRACNWLDDLARFTGVVNPTREQLLADYDHVRGVLKDKLIRNGGRGTRMEIVNALHNAGVTFQDRCLHCNQVVCQ